MAKQRDEPKSAKPRRTQTLRQKFAPQQSVLLITKAGPREIAPHKLSAVDVGYKALRLSAIPLGWTPHYFVVSAKCFEEQISSAKLDRWVADCVSEKAFINPDRLMIRSSGTVESMRDRGSLVSKRCTSLKIIATIEELRKKISRSTGPLVHWIVQEAINSRRTGHLSNERRVRKEQRDWVAEFEASENHRSSVIPFGIRNWRDGRDVSSLDLECGSETEIIRRLRQVAKWGCRFEPRIHFEWVWDGRRLWIVQADAEETTHGEDPTSKFPAILKANIGTLHTFHRAEAADYQNYSKLRNAALYRELGYDMPLFYVANDPSGISKILGGEIFDDLEKDLVDLTKRPLIIRTDGVKIPDEKREMLPRSDPLASAVEAKDWLLKNFSVEIQRADLADGKICLIAHHFIPSVASAWARAEPETRLVRIEALWGIPEGLYWYSHDTFEVDTQEVRLPDAESLDANQFSVSERLRYKGTFVTADENGKWDAAKVSAPFDWRCSIKKPEWLFKIALSTRRIAEKERYPVAVMWFVDNHQDATQDKVLPWHHVKSELAGPPRASPRRKFRSSEDFLIENKDNWETLEQELQTGRRVERVVVAPEDTALIRNPTFAKELGRLGAEKKFVIELSGGILSHAYYILTKEGAQVECIDLFGVNEELAEYNKIVRDNIPEIISKRGENAAVVKLEGEALITTLRQKLVEESFEVLDAKCDPDVLSELADVREVINALCSALKLSASRLSAVQKKKRQKRGGFKKGVMLTRTTTPHSIQQPTPESLKPLLKLQADMPQVISRPSDLPTKPLHRRPDLRQVEQQPEKVFTFATELSKLDDLSTKLNFSLPIETRNQRLFDLSLELRRSAGSLRGNIRIRLLPSQSPFEFADNEEDTETDP